MAKDSQPTVSIEVGKFHLSIDFNSDWNIDKQEWKFFKIFVVFGLIDDLVQIIKIFFTLIFSRKLMERVDDIFYFSFSLLYWFNFNLLFLMMFSQMEFRFPLFLFFFLLFWYLILRFTFILFFGIFSAAGTFLIFFQEIFSSYHDIFWSPITSGFIFFIRFRFRRWWLEFFFLFSWRVSILILKELFHFFIEFGHDFVSQFLFHCVESFCGIFIKFLFTWWGISSDIIIDSFQCFHKYWRILSLLFNNFAGFFNLFKKLLKVFPYFFKILVIKLVVNFSTKIFNGVPFFIFFSLYSSLFFFVSVIIIVTKILR